jgi:hypothetical protein
MSWTVIVTLTFHRRKPKIEFSYQYRSKHALESFTDSTSFIGNCTNPTEATNGLIFKVSMDDIPVNWSAYQWEAERKIK